MPRIARQTRSGVAGISIWLMPYSDRASINAFITAVACALGSTYGFLQGAWPFGLVEAIWALVVLRRWYRAR